MFFIDCLLVILILDNNLVFVLFGIIILINDNNLLGNVFVGVGFNIVVILCVLVILNVDIIVGMGIFNCVMIKFVLIIVFFELIIFLGVIVIFVLL